MKRLTKIITALAILCCVGCVPKNGVEQEAGSRTLSHIDRQAERLKRKILNSSTSVKPSGVIYYLSADGDDANDGLSPQTPLRSIAKLNMLDLKPSDGVMFRRGDVWRGKINTRKGVTYSAYGKGDKPRIYGSPCDAAVEGEWIATATPNVYMYSLELSDDVGTLVFNGGEQNAIKILKVYHADGTTTNVYTGEPFAGGCDLKRDLDFFHDYRDEKRLYLCSTEGNPSERFESIELLTRGNIINATDNVHIDNLCIMYGGSHGIGSGTTKDLTVTNCELGWIGGSIQSESAFGRNHPTRYGNAVEIYGGCENFMVSNCYIYQIYDAAVTHQHQGDVQEPLIMRNVTYSNNLIEDCVYSVEYFLGREDTIQSHQMEEILIANNIMRRAGYGWGKQRPDKETPAHIKSWSHHTNNATNFVVANNIFDRSTHDLLNIAAAKSESMPTLANNTYIQHRGASAGAWGSQGVVYTFDDTVAKSLEEVFGEKSGKIIYIEE